MSSFFIRRPIVAIVIAILTVIIGVIMAVGLPVAQFPNIAPPQIMLQASYPGADAKTLENAVSVPIEQQINGVDNMTYMYSLNATFNQQTTLIVNFDLKTDPNVDLLLTQSREQLATGQLPPEVNSYGITLKKSATAPLMLIAVNSPHGTHDAAYLANYAYINLNDPIARLYGVGQTIVFGAGQYAMRIWVNPDQLAKLGITVTDIVNAIKAQNTVNPAGQVGGEPAPANQQYTYAVLAQGRLSTPEEFGNVIVRETPNGGTVRVKDVARVERGTQDYSMMCRLNGKPAAGIAVYQLPGSNAVQTVAGVRKLMAQMKQRFPEDMDYAISLDQTLPVTEGMKEITETLVIALALVIFVVYLFLQDWRATLIPTLAVPVSLIGTFVLFPLFGFSINTLSMFGLVLAIGLVVDDAIVVVEGVQHHIEEGLSPKDASRKAMDELSGPVVGIALVLASVFVPTIFIPGITGRLYQQFAITVAISVMLSAFNALTLSPALSALLLRPKTETRGPLGKFFGYFNRYFERSTDSFVRWSGDLIRKAAVVLVLLVVAGLAAWLFGAHLPTSFLPDEDQGYVYINMQLPNAASLERTSAAAKQVEDVLAKTPGVDYTTSVVGFSLLSVVRTTYNAFFWVSLKPWDERTSRAEQYQEIKTRLNQELGRLPQGTVFSFSPPAIPGVGTAGGVTFVLEDRAGKDVQFLAANVAKFLAAARKRPEFSMRYDEYRSAQLNANAAPGYSADQARAALVEVFKQTMPSEMGYDWTGMSYQEAKAEQGVPASVIFGFSLLFVFLVLAALYESWTVPFSVLLSTPVAVFGALAALWLRRFIVGLYMPPYMVQMENDVYTQIGLVMLIGLGAKNSILIVAFAKEDYERGMSLVDAALSAARLRFRPLMMTALAFIVGCVPLWIASGAGSVARQIIGTTVIGGMLAETFIGRFFVPAIFYVVEKFSGAEKRKALPLAPAEAPSLGDGIM